MDNITEWAMSVKRCTDLFNAVQWFTPLKKIIKKIFWQISPTEINKYPLFICKFKWWWKTLATKVIECYLCWWSSWFFFLLALGYMTAAGFYPCLSLPKIINETSPGFLYIYLVELSGIRWGSFFRNLSSSNPPDCLSFSQYIHSNSST